ncbi:hypothetical protein POF50_014525 [Streptomyces sp. SL13]|uniref:Uncharacterized protein n=1 Tax=Streptantibioticus silvisoli TaxID=2705255 RepID=A0AA90K900_9ACTN|nr:hypothetical protein [Streptantibioticus silvisoli]MDI5970543.1 hypothetical protein [Streptantibioticus silvisoli]
MSTPPPPQGPNPYQQPQQPPQGGYGFPQQPQQPGGYPTPPPQQPGGYPTPPPQQPGFPQQSQPGFPQPGYPQGGFPQSGYPTPAPAPKKRGKLFLRLGILVVVIIVGIVVAVLNTDDSQTVKAGDCVQNTGSDSDPTLKQVDCGDAKAQYKVLKKVSGTSDGQTACENVTGATNDFYETENGSSFVLCLAANK